MGMRSAESVQATSTPAVTRAPMLRVAVGAQAAEVAGLCVAIVFNAIDAVSGRTWTTSNAVAFIGIEVIVAVGMAWIASGVARVRPWSRTPALMTQLFTAFIAIWLLDAHRLAWGVPALLFAIAGFAGLLTPTSMRALTRQD